MLNEDIKMDQTNKIENNFIDYRKLLKKCMESWTESEGGCWDPRFQFDLSEEEMTVIEEIAVEIDKDIEEVGGEENWTLNRINKTKGE
jgi:hypothetical protein